MPKVQLKKKSCLILLISSYWVSSVLSLLFSLLLSLVWFVSPVSCYSLPLCQSAVLPHVHSFQSPTVSGFFFLSYVFQVWSFWFCTLLDRVCWVYMWLRLLPTLTAGKPGYFCVMNVAGLSLFCMLCVWNCVLKFLKFSGTTATEIQTLRDCTDVARQILSQCAIKNKAICERRGTVSWPL